MNSPPDDLVRGLLDEPPPPLRYGEQSDVSSEAPGMLLSLVPEGARVLDVGCGTGAISKLLREKRGAEVTGLEPQPERAKLAREHGGTVIEAPFTPDVYEDLGSYDVVLFADVLEHLASPAAALDLARQLLVPGGCVVASIPNVAHWSIRFDLARGRFRYEADGLMDATHLRFFTEETVCRLFQECGLEIHEMRMSHGATLRPYKRRAPFRWLKRKWRRQLAAAGVRAFPQLFGAQFVLSATPQSS